MSSACNNSRIPMIRTLISHGQRERESIIAQRAMTLCLEGSCEGAEVWDRLECVFDGRATAAVAVLARCPQDHITSVSRPASRVKDPEKWSRSVHSGWIMISLSGHNFYTRTSPQLSSRPTQSGSVSGYRCWLESRSSGDPQQCHIPDRASTLLISLWWFGRW